MITEDTTLERIQKEDSIETILLNKNQHKPTPTDYNRYSMYRYEYTTEELLLANKKKGYKIVPFQYTCSDYGGYRNQAILNLAQERVVVEETTIKTFCAVKTIGEIASFDNMFHSIVEKEFGPRSIDDYKPKLL